MAERFICRIEVGVPNALLEAVHRAAVLAEVFELLLPNKASPFEWPLPSTSRHSAAPRGVWGCLGVQCAAEALVLQNGSATVGIWEDEGDAGGDVPRYPSRGLTYQCNEGFFLQGGGPSRSCRSSGEWDGTAPSCVPCTCSCASGQYLVGSCDGTTPHSGCTKWQHLKSAAEGCQGSPMPLPWVVGIMGLVATKLRRRRFGSKI